MAGRHEWKTLIEKMSVERRARIKQGVRALAKEVRKGSRQKRVRKAI
jgi:hypothetical protein